jgi:acetyl esterase
MRPLAEAVGTAERHAPPLASGISHYIDLFRDTPPAPDLATMRLNGDLGAWRFARADDARVRRYDTSIAIDDCSIPVRVYDPGGGGMRPAICYFHGGGFSMGSIESFDIIGAALAERCSAVVVSVHYRRLPEADYAAAQADCDATFAWMIRQAEALGIDPARTGVAGDSAGALLALCCAANQRDSGRPRPAFQLLFYGTFAMDPARPAYAASRDPLLTGERVRQYIALFHARGGLEGHPAPVERTDLAGLPPTHVVAAELDPLREEAGELVAALQAAGVAASMRVAPGMIHGFLRAIAVSDAARAELNRAAIALQAILEGNER